MVYLPWSLTRQIPESHSTGLTQHLASPAQTSWEKRTLVVLPVSQTGMEGDAYLETVWALGCQPTVYYLTASHIFSSLWIQIPGSTLHTAAPAPRAKRYCRLWCVYLLSTSDWGSLKKGCVSCSLGILKTSHIALTLGFPEDLACPPRLGLLRICRLGSEEERAG